MKETLHKGAQLRNEMKHFMTELERSYRLVAASVRVALHSSVRLARSAIGVPCICTPTHF